MNVIPFPGPRTARADEQTAIVYVVAAIRILGEPARAPEIRRLLAGLGDSGPRFDLDQLLRANCARAPDQLGAAVFRCVTLGAEEAWAFTPNFRDGLSHQGLEPILRASP